MLKNTKVATQLVASFALIVFLIMGLGLFSWSRLMNMDDALKRIENAQLLETTTVSLGREISDAKQTLTQFTLSSDQADSDAALQNMQDVRDNAAALENAGIESASGMVSLKDRHISELLSYISLHEQRENLLNQIQSTGITYRRKIGDLVSALEDRDTNNASYRALSASEKFLVARVRVDRFTGGMPFSELETALPPLQEAIDNLNMIPASLLSPEERGILTTSLRGLAEFRTLIDQIGELEMQTRSSLATVYGSTVAVNTQLGLVQSEVGAANKRLSDAAHSLVENTIFAILAGVAFVALLGAAISVLLSVNLSSRLNAIVAQTKSLAEGDLSVQITHAEGTGDLAKIAQALNVFKQNAIERQQLDQERLRLEAEVTEKLERDSRKQMRVVRDIEDGLNRLAKGDFTHTINSPAEDPFPEEYDELRVAFNLVASNLADTLSRIVGVAQQVRGGSEEITSAAQDLARRAETQAATLEQSAAALNELTESVRSTADLAKSAEKATRDNRLTAEDGAAIVNDAINAMQKIEKSSDQISRIIGVIDDIAFQTNLLALNAGVEAARAGEAGRGFAVVASEVRGLAQRASDSAREIKGLISESTQQVEAGSSLVTRTGQSLAQILSKAKEVSDQASAIAVAAVDQSGALGEINSGVNQLDQVTQQNAAVAEQTNAAAGSLQQQSTMLLNELSGFIFDKRSSRSGNVVHIPKADSVIPVAATGNARQPSTRMMEF